MDTKLFEAFEDLRGKISTLLYAQGKEGTTDEILEVVKALETLHIPKEESTVGLKKEGSQSKGSIQSPVKGNNNCEFHLEGIDPSDLSLDDFVPRKGDLKETPTTPTRSYTCQWKCTCGWSGETPKVVSSPKGNPNRCPKCNLFPSKIRK
jgi:hypothetical protein